MKRSTKAPVGTSSEAGARPAKLPNTVVPEGKAAVGGTRGATTQDGIARTRASMKRAK